MATSDDDITRFLHSLALSDSVFEVIPSSNKVRCLLTSHELPYDLTKLQQYTTTKKFKRLYTKFTERGSTEFKKYEHLFIPSRRFSSSRLYCPLTRKEVNKLPHELEKYVTGVKFQKALRKKEAAAEEADDDKENGTENGNDEEIDNDDDGEDRVGEDEGGVWVPDGLSSDEEQDVPAVDSAMESVTPPLVGEENIDPVPQVNGEKKSKSKGKKKQKPPADNVEEIDTIKKKKKTKKLIKKDEEQHIPSVDSAMESVPQTNEPDPPSLGDENIDPVPQVNDEKKSKSKGKKKRKLPAEKEEEVDAVTMMKKKKKKLVKKDD